MTSLSPSDGFPDLSEASLRSRNEDPCGNQMDGVGTEIEHYKLLSVLGEGGFGIVYLAEQRYPIRRKVALKLIKPGMDSSAVVARFEAERQALAMMDHPNIARVLDGGTTDTGRPYFVMELVKGVPLTEYCDKNQLNTHERLKLFAQVCDGVQHAHQKAIIHRDLKPGNILVTEVDGQPVPKIIDFGLAKATDHELSGATQFTEQGMMVGTPEYMSPEQAADEEIDTRTDIYALGVVLYVMMAGALPFESKELRKAGHDAIRRIIREQDPPRPSTRFSNLGEQTTVVAEARGLVELGIMFPEFREAAAWRDEGYRRLRRELEAQVLSDGVHVERTPGYHGMTLGCFMEPVRLGLLNGVEVVGREQFIEKLEQMHEFYLYGVKPDGRMEQFGDSSMSAVAGPLRRGWEMFRREDMLWVVTGGAEGRPPVHRS